MSPGILLKPTCLSNIDVGAPSAYELRMPSSARAFYKPDHDLRFLSANEVALGYWGKSAAEVIGWLMSDAFPAAVGTEPFEAHRSALRSFRPYRGRVRSPVLGSDVELEIHPNADGLDVSFVLIRDLAAAPH